MRVMDFADGFLGGIAEETLSALVPTVNDAVEIFGDDGVIGGLDDGGEAIFIMFGGAALSDLLDHDDEALDGTAAIADGRHAQVDPYQRAVFADVTFFG